MLKDLDSIYAELVFDGGDGDDAEHTVQITIPVKGYQRAVELFNSVVVAVRPVVDQLEDQLDEDVSYSAWVLDSTGSAVY